VSRRKCCLYIGDATTGLPPISPTMPRARIAAPLQGSRLSSANRPASVRKTATCTPWARTATPASGTRSAAWHTGSQPSSTRPAHGAARRRGRGDIVCPSALTGIGVLQLHGPFGPRGRARLAALADMDDMLIGTVVVDHRAKTAQCALVP